MQATREQDTGAEDRFHFTVRMGRKNVETRHTYTMEQAEEINDLVTESARQALGYNNIEQIPVTTD